MHIPPGEEITRCDLLVCQWFVVRERTEKLIGQHNAACDEHEGKDQRVIAQTAFLSFDVFVEKERGDEETHDERQEVRWQEEHARHQGEVPHECENDEQEQCNEEPIRARFAPSHNGGEHRHDGEDRSNDYCDETDEPHGDVRHQRQVLVVHIVIRCPAVVDAFPPQRPPPHRAAVLIPFAHIEVRNALVVLGNELERCGEHDGECRQGAVSAFLEDSFVLLRCAVVPLVAELGVDGAAQREVDLPHGDEDHEETEARSAKEREEPAPILYEP